MTFDMTFVTITEDEEGRLHVEELWMIFGMEAQAIPRPGDVVLIDGENHRVAYAAWDYSEWQVRVVVRKIIGDLT